MSGFQPSSASFGVVTQADGLGWYNGAPLTLSFASADRTFPARIAVRLGVEPIHADTLLRVLLCSRRPLTCGVWIGWPLPRERRRSRCAVQLWGRSWSDALGSGRRQARRLAKGQSDTSEKRNPAATRFGFTGVCRAAEYTRYRARTATLNSAPSKWTPSRVDSGSW